MTVTSKTQRQWAHGKKQPLIPDNFRSFLCPYRTRPLVREASISTSLHSFQPKSPETRNVNKRKMRKVNKRLDWVLSSYSLVKKLKSRIYFSSSYFFLFCSLTKESMESSSLTRASITRVPTMNLTSAEEIAPRCKEFTRTTPPIDADADVQAPSKVKQRVNFFQNFLSRWASFKSPLGVSW